MPIPRPKFKPTILVVMILIFAIIISALAILFVGEFGEGHKVEIYGSITDNGLLDINPNIQTITVGEPIPDNKILSFGLGLMDPPWVASLTVEYRLDNKNDPLQFAHPYKDDVVLENLITGSGAQYSIWVRHLEPGTYTADLILYEDSLLGSRKVFHTKTVTINV